ncbi:MAG TPA: RNB domain-containing ribonuclease [Solirubrobacteraceae bacterium]|nr:RNB domain-containing ribonuclease [Solirubrobacteraceae bacterium]
MSATAAAPPVSRVAVIERRGKFLVAEPFFERGPRLVVGRGGRAGVGDLVVVGPAAGTLARRDGRGSSRVEIKRRIGRPDVAADVIEALMLDRGLRRSFDPAVEREAQEAAAMPVSEAMAASPGRRDLRDLPTFTIDPVSARDFDDAISAEELSAGVWRVWVHIADVSAYVPPRSLVDREAYRRGTSVYVPGKVEPMLPPALSNGACSLVPGEDRLAVTVEMTITGDTVERAAFHRSLIRSDERLDYDRVDRVLAGTEHALEPWAGPLAAARAAAAALGARRASRGALVVDSAEPEFVFDHAGNVLASEPVAQTESHRLIEHLMIAANEAVARVLEERHVPALYRVHARPEGAAVQRLVEQLASLDVPTPPVPAQMTPQQAADVVGEISRLVAVHVEATGRGRKALTSLVLRTLKQAYYDSHNIGHAGLQSPRYCHFTSPIRRYPDLICHRALLSAVSGSEPAPEGSWVTAAGPWASARERGAMTIERDADDVALCFLLERTLAEAGFGGETVFDGEVTGLIGAGAFVSFGEQGFEGLLSVRRLRGDWWELGEQGTVLVGSRTGRGIRLGDPVRVQVGQVDAPRGRVDLLPVEL